MAEEAAGVQYTVKELLGRIEGKIDLLTSQLLTKADSGRVAELELRVDDIQRDVEVAKTKLTVAEAVQRNTRWLIFTAVPGAATLAALLAPWLQKTVS